MMSSVTRVARRFELGDAPGAIADDLMLIREHGGFDEATDGDLAATMSLLGIERGLEGQEEHARKVLRGLVEWALTRVLEEHPVRSGDDNRSPSGTRVRQPWQAIAATSLVSLLLQSGGVKGRVVDVRQDSADLYVLNAATVKRYEDKLLERVIAPRIHERLLTARDLVAATAPSGQLAGTAEPVEDPLWTWLGATEAELAESLLRNARIPGEGFEAQQFGLNEPSRASTGIVTYALAMSPSISDEAIGEIYQEILGWITLGGAIHRRQDATAESTWTESQCLLALTARPHLINRHPAVVRLADSLLRRQRHGAWAYRNGPTSQLHPAWSFYPLLALNRATRADLISGLRYRNAAQLAARHAESILETDATAMDHLMGLSVLYLATSGNDDDWHQTLIRHTQTLADTLNAQDARSIQPSIITDDRQPLWHARINPALLYLHARRVLGPRHPFTQSLTRRLLSEYDPINQGWTNSTAANAMPYTWTTALALRSCQLLRQDIQSQLTPWPLPVPDWLGPSVRAH